MKLNLSWLDFLYPPRCPICGKLLRRKEFLCTSCRESLFSETEACPVCAYPHGRGRKCPECRHRKLYIDGMFALGSYGGNLKRLIQEFKYQGRQEVVHFFTPYMVQGISTRIHSGQWLDPDGLVPIPLCAGRLKQRGFNQAELLAKEAALHLGIPLLNVLARVKDTESQTRLGRKERAANLRGAFRLMEDEIHSHWGEKPSFQGKTLILVDDIFTSGATINEAARVLRRGGVGKLYAAVIGR